MAHEPRKSWRLCKRDCIPDAVAMADNDAVLGRMGTVASTRTKNGRLTDGGSEQTRVSETVEPHRSLAAAVVPSIVGNESSEPAICGIMSLRDNTPTPSVRTGPPRVAIRPDPHARWPQPPRFGCGVGGCCRRQLRKTGWTRPRNVVRATPVPNSLFSGIKVRVGGALNRRKNYTICNTNAFRGAKSESGSCQKRGLGTRRTCFHSLTEY